MTYRIDATDDGQFEIWSEQEFGTHLEGVYETRGEAVDALRWIKARRS